MAYSVNDIGSVEAWTALSYAADDIVLDFDSTTCMLNGTLGEDCDEFKEGTINCKVEINVAPAAINELKVRFYLNSIMSAGDNSLLPYIDGNSVSTTNEVISAYDTAGQWVEHICSQAFIAELADIGGKCYVRLSSNDLAKSKIGEVNADVIQELYTFDGVTYDDDGAALGSVDYRINRRTGLAPETWITEFSGTSNASTGVFTHEVPVGSYRMIAFIDQEPQIMDIGTVFFVSEGKAADDKFTVGAFHGLANDDQLEIYQMGSQALPAGFSEGTTYHVVGLSGNTFGLSLTQGGSAVNITTDGAGLLSGLPVTS